MSIGSSNVNYHKKSPRYYTEIKVELPAVLHAKHHVLFLVYYVSSSPTADNNGLSYIGYSFLKLLHYDAKYAPSFFIHFLYCAFAFLHHFSSIPL